MSNKWGFLKYYRIVSDTHLWGYCDYLSCLSLMTSWRKPGILILQNTKKLNFLILVLNPFLSWSSKCSREERVQKPQQSFLTTATQGLSFVLRCYNKLCMKSKELAFKCSTFLICVAEKLKQCVNIWHLNYCWCLRWIFTNYSWWSPNEA